MEETAKATVKLVVDKAANRVLFAEAGKDFVDFLFHIHELPVGTVSQLVCSVSEDALGSVQNITDSIRSLPDKYMISNQKAALLDPEVRNCASKLKVSSASESPHHQIVYRCNCRYSTCMAVLDNPHALCPTCKGKCENKLVLFEPSDETVAKLLDGEGGYVKGLPTYMVTDDLMVKPMMFNSYFDLLREFINVKHVEDIEEKVVDVGSDECKKLVEASFRSKTALTDTFLPKESPNAPAFPPLPDHALRNIYTIMREDPKLRKSILGE